jgi:Acetyltransferase (GNAT) domain
MESEILFEPPGEQLLDKWNAFLSHVELPTRYVSPAFFADPFIHGGERFAVLAIDEMGEVAGVLTGIRAGKRITSGLPTRPQIALRQGSEQHETAAALFGALSNALSKNADLIEVFSWDSISGVTDLGFKERDDLPGNEIVVIDLSAGDDEIFNGFSPTRQKELKKAARRKGLEVKQVEDLTELEELHKIQIDWSQRKGVTPEPFESFKRAFEEKDCRAIFIAKYEGRVIAGSIFRFFRSGVVEYAANYSLTEYHKFKANHLIGWRAIQWARANGFSHASMGAAHLFLRRFGGEIVKSYRYSLDKTFLRRHEKREQLRHLLRSAFYRLPAFVRHRLKSAPATA